MCPLMRLMLTLAQMGVDLTVLLGNSLGYRAHIFLPKPEINALSATWQGRRLEVVLEAAKLRL